MSIQTALRSLPTKPGVIIAVAIIVVVGGWQGYSLRAACLQRADLVLNLTSAIEKAVAKGGDEKAMRLDLGDVIPFAWDEVKIVQNYRPTTASLDCPFGWHWTEEARDKLAADGLLTVLAFFDQGAFVNFMDYSGGLARFEIDDRKIAKTQALFEVVPPGNGKGPHILRPLQSGNS